MFGGRTRVFWHEVERRLALVRCSLCGGLQEYALAGWLAGWQTVLQGECLYSVGFGCSTKGIIHGCTLKPSRDFCICIFRITQRITE